jgi:plastocyanin
MKRALLVAVALAATTAASAPLTGTAAAAGPHAAPRHVAMGLSAFSPSHVDVLAGDLVTWMNDSVRPHTVTARDGTWDSGRVFVGEGFTHRFATPGAVGYYCRLHTFGGEIVVQTLLLDQPSGAGGPGRPLELTGRAALPPGTSVSIEGDAGGGYAPVSTTTVSLDGTVRASVAPAETTTYRAIAGGQASPPVRLPILDRRVAIAVRRDGPRTVVDVQVTPPSPRVMAVLQLRLRHRFGWWPVARARLDRESRARFAIRRGHRVSGRVVLTMADGATITAVSRKVTIHRPPLDRRGR